MIKLSVITPYYNRLEYIKKLANVLEPQLDNEVEWIIIDDGSNEKELDNLKATVYHLSTNSGGASIPRNVGLDNCNGEYIVFIDSDDLVTDDYIQEIKKSFQLNYDYCYFSWRTREQTIQIKNEPPKWNCCVWNCIYKKELIGDIRFNPKLKIAEDYEFNQKVRKGKHTSINKVLYYYNIDTPNSLIKGGE
jgi:glycosyltransferase involved in cell wall biosynthesis